MSYTEPQARRTGPQAETTRQPRIIVFDSGLGGLTVFGEIARLRPSADYLYAADDAVFPYGRLSEAELVTRVVSVMERLVPLHRPDIVVIACNTASVSVLPPLRAHWPAVPFVGTVPAIKPAVALSRSRAISVLATPGTVTRDYTRDLVRSFAQDCTVTLVGAPRLAALAEAALRGERVPDGEIRAEIAPAFVEDGGRRTDAVVLACTHYPLLIDRLNALAPWPVAFIDPASAIARRTDDVLSRQGFGAPAGTGRPEPPAALFTSCAEPAENLRRALDARGLGILKTLPHAVPGLA